MRRLLIITVMLLAVIAGGVAAMLMTIPALAASGPPARPASVTKITPPPSQVTDGLYKSLVIVTPDRQVLICILTRLPQSYPHFTIPPEYSCGLAPAQQP